MAKQLTQQQVQKVAGEIIAKAARSWAARNSLVDCNALNQYVAVYAEEWLHAVPARRASWGLVYAELHQQGLGW